MFSGKTSELIRRLKRYAFAQYRCLMIKFIKDNRYSEESVATHDGQMIPAIASSNLYEVIPSAEMHDVIGIDEGQFVRYQATYEYSKKNVEITNFRFLLVPRFDHRFRRRYGESRKNCHRCFFGWHVSKNRVWQDFTAGTVGRKRGQIERRLYVMLSRCRLYQTFDLRHCRKFYTEFILSHYSQVQPKLKFLPIQVEVIGGVDKYMAVCRECHRLEKPVRNSPCKILENMRMETCNGKIPKFSI